MYFYAPNQNGATVDSLAPKQVVAYRGMICSANQNVPFYDLCLYGTQSNLRGYTGGEFQNRRIVACSQRKLNTGAS